MRTVFKGTLHERLDRGSMPEPNSGCVLWMGPSYDKDGYGLVYDPELQRNVRAHRAAWHRAKGAAAPIDLFVLHKCDVPACLNPAHLWLGTNDDNMADMKAKGRATNGGTGRRNAMLRSVLTEGAVVEILRDPRPYSKIASSHGVAKSTIGMIKTRRIWKHVGAL